MAKTKAKAKPKRKGNPNLGRAQKKCKGKTGNSYKSCVKKASKKKK